MWTAFRLRPTALALVSLPALALLATPHMASAGIDNSTPQDPITSTPVTAEDTDTRAFAGVRWTFGKSVMPELLAGVQSTETDSDGDAKGMQASISYDLATMGLGKLRFEALTGNESTQATFGVGYSFVSQSPFVGMGARGNHLFGGVDLLLGPATPEFFIGIDTMDSLDAPSPTCDSGTYDEESDLCISDTNDGDV